MGTDAPFVQERLALFGKIVFLLAFSFFVVFNLLFVLGGKVPLAQQFSQQRNIWHFTSASALLALWIINS